MCDDSCDKRQAGSREDNVINIQKKIDSLSSTVKGEKRGIRATVGEPKGRNVDNEPLILGARSLFKTI